MKDSLIKSSAMKVFRNNIGTTIALAVAILAVVIASLIPPQILKYIIDYNLVPKSNHKLLIMAMSYICVLLFVGVFDFVKEALITILGQKITKEIRIEMMGKLERLNMSFFSSNGSGAIVSRFTNDVEAINSLFTSGIISMIVDCFKIIGIVASICMFSIKLGALTLILLPIIYGITRSFQKKMLKAQIENRILVGKVNNHISESLKNIQMIKVYSKEDYMVNFYDSVFSPIIQITRAIVIAVIVILSSKQLNYLGISLGMVAASIELISNLFSPIENLGMELQNIQQAVSGIKRVDEFYNEPEDDGKKDELKAERIIPNRDDIKISFNNVTFKYDEDTEVLENINLDINTSEKVTFVGRTGVGKSTLFKLIMGILKPSEGSITINDVDVYDIPNSQKRKIFGYVDQSFHMIKGNVMDQITLQDNSITLEQVMNALDFVDIREYVESLENGIYTEIVDNNIFSQGQKQLLSIARAVVMNPPILLLDEITANLDSLTENNIVNVLAKASEAHTILSISHRLSSMIASDKIVILDKGKIKNSGSPEMLLKNDQWYSSHIALEKLTWN